MRAVLDNDHSVLYGADPALTKKINTVTSYLVDGHWFTPAFRARQWDGRVKLLRKTRDGGLRFPTGLLPDVMRVIENRGLSAPRLDDRRRKLGVRKSLPWLADDIVDRDYQTEAVNVATAERDYMTGRGILKLPIRSGKTVIAARLIRHWGLRTVFVATSQLILAQTVKLFTRIFGEHVGVIGEGDFNPGFITVASIQRLQRMDAPVKRFLNAVDVEIVDEVHHMQGDSWREPVLRSGARYRIGLSATVRVSRKLCERSAVWLKASTGNIIIDVPIGRLIEGGYILAPNIFIAEMNGSGTGLDWQTAYDELIVKARGRNRVIMEAAQIAADAGHRVLIDTGRLVHIKRLATRARKLGLAASMIYGGVNPRQRADILAAFKSGEKPVLIGTVMGEGVDVPVLSVVINAEGGKDPGATIQRMRNLTTHPDKDQAILIDFMDDGNGYLKRHSRARLKQYKAESAFDVTGPLPVADFLQALRTAVGK